MDNQPSNETKFTRGEIGVDGQATEEQEEVAEIERGRAREQFLRGKSYLGREFLTWLLFRSESGEPIVEHEGAPVTVLFADRLALRGIAGEIVEETVRGAMSPYSPLVRRALGRGLLIHAARLRIFHGERVYEVSLDADVFVLRGAKLPALMSEEAADRLDERLRLTEELAALVRLLLAEFLQARAGRGWGAYIVPAMKEWMAEAGSP